MTRVFFHTLNGNDKKQDILISFETRTPHVFISDIY